MLPKVSTGKREREREIGEKQSAAREYERVLFFFVVVWTPLNSFYAPLRKTEEKICAKTERKCAGKFREFSLK